MKIQSKKNAKIANDSSLLHPNSLGYHLHLLGIVANYADRLEDYVQANGISKKEIKEIIKEIEKEDSIPVWDE